MFAKHTNKIEWYLFENVCHCVAELKAEDLDHYQDEKNSIDQYSAMITIDNVGYDVVFFPKSKSVCVFDPTHKKVCSSFDDLYHGDIVIKRFIELISESVLLSNPYLSEEAKIYLKKIESLKEKGLLTEQEYQDQRRAILFSKSKDGARDYTSSVSQQPTDVSSSSSTTPPQRRSIWKTLGVITSLVIVGFVLFNHSRDDLNGSNASNPYKEIDDYLEYCDARYWRDGSTVYFRESQDMDPMEEEILGSLLRSPDIVSPLGQGLANLGRLASDSYRNSIIDRRIGEDRQLFQLIADSGRSFCYKWVNKDIFYYSSDEIRRRLNR